MEVGNCLYVIMAAKEVIISSISDDSKNLEWSYRNLIRLESNYLEGKSSFY